MVKNFEKKTLEGKVGKDLWGHPVPPASPKPCPQGPHPHSSGTLPQTVTGNLPGQLIPRPEHSAREK